MSSVGSKCGRARCAQTYNTDRQLYTSVIRRYTMVLRRFSHPVIGTRVRIIDVTNVILNGDLHTDIKK